MYGGTGRSRKELTGLFPAFLLTGAIFSCFHFLYYDFVVAGLPLLLLFTEPHRYFQVRFCRLSRDRKGAVLPPLPYGRGPDELPSEVMLRYYRPSLFDLTPPPMPLLPQGRKPAGYARRFRRCSFFSFCSRRL